MQTSTQVTGAPAGNSAGATLRHSVTAAIREAVMAELVETGMARMSMDAVARRAGVGKAAIYRRWSTRDAMVNEVVLTAVTDALPPVPETGTLRGDVRALLEFFRSQLSAPGFRSVAADLLAESTRDENLARVLDESVARPRRAASRQILLNAIARGELPPNLDLDLIIDLLIAPVAFRILILRDPISDERLELLADVLCTGLAAAQRDS